MGYIKNVPIEDQIIEHIPYGYAVTKTPLTCKEGIIEAKTRVFVRYYLTSGSNYQLSVFVRGDGEEKQILEYITVSCTTPEEMDKWTEEHLIISEADKAETEKHKAYQHEMLQTRNRLIFDIQLGEENWLASPVIAGVVAAILCGLSGYFIFGGRAWIVHSMIGFFVAMFGCFAFNTVRIGNKTEKKDAISDLILDDLYSRLDRGSGDSD